MTYRENKTGGPSPHRLTGTSTVSVVVKRGLEWPAACGCSEASGQAMSSQCREPGGVSRASEVSRQGWKRLAGSHASLVVSTPVCSASVRTTCRWLGPFTLCPQRAEHEPRVVQFFLPSPATSRDQSVTGPDRRALVSQRPCGLCLRAVWTNRLWTTETQQFQKPALFQR